MKIIHKKLRLTANFLRLYAALTLLCLMMLMTPPRVLAAGSLVFPTNPQNGSEGVEAVIPSPPPTQGVTISNPVNGQVFSTSPITVNGICPGNLLIKIYSNNIFVGSTDCSNGSFSLKISLFNGLNSLVAIDYDSLNQAGPSSNTVNVTFNSAQFATFGTLLFITSEYAKRGANPGDVLTWPITINGGVGPYAISVNWGDGQSPELVSQQFPGNLTIYHTYAAAGTYSVTITAIDKNGEEAFLQVVAVANGPIAQSSAKNSSAATVIVKTEIIWWPALVAIPLIIVTFWLGRRYEDSALRKRLSEQRIRDNKN